MLTALFDYLISKEQPVRSTDSLPHLSDETIRKFMDTAINQPRMLRSKFDTLVKLMMQRGELERFTHITYNVLLGRLKLE